MIIKYDDVLDELSDSSKEAINGIDSYVQEHRNMQLDEAYRFSPSEYNELFDEFEKEDREARKENGTYSIDDYLDDLEDERKKNFSRMI